MSGESAAAHRLADGTQTVEIAYRNVDWWPLANGDAVVIVERTLTQDGRRTRSYTWHLTARNGQKVQGGQETFVSKWNAQRSARRHFPKAES